MAQALVEMTYDEAVQLVHSQGSITQKLRALLTIVDYRVESLAGHNYISDTSRALADKWHSDTRKQFEKIITMSEEAQDGTVKACATQRDNNTSPVADIHSA